MTVEIVLRRESQRLCPASSLPTARILSSGIITLIDMYRIHLFNKLEMALSTQVCVASFLSLEGKYIFSPKIMSSMKYLRNMYACQCQLDWSRVFRLSVQFRLVSFSVQSFLFQFGHCNVSRVHLFVFLSAQPLGCVISRRQH